MKTLPLFFLASLGTFIVQVDAIAGETVRCSEIGHYLDDKSTSTSLNVECSGPTLRFRGWIEDDTPVKSVTAVVLTRMKKADGTYTFPKETYIDLTDLGDKKPFTSLRAYLSSPDVAKKQYESASHPGEENVGRYFMYFTLDSDLASSRLHPTRHNSPGVQRSNSVAPSAVIDEAKAASPLQ